MIRLWQYWPVRVAGGFLLALPLLGLIMFGGFYIVSGSLMPGLAAFAAAVFYSHGYSVGLPGMDRAAGLKPRSEPGETNPLPIVVAMLSFPMAGAGLISLGTLFPEPDSLAFPARAVIILMAIFPPFLFALNAAPRHLRDAVVLACCVMAMFVAGIAAPRITGAILGSVNTGDHGTGVTLALFAGVFLALNAPLAVLLVKSGVCPLKDRQVVGEEARA